MSLLEAIILGIVQGLTEFLPVSSSGHIEIFKVIQGVEIQEALLFTVVLHLATALSTLVIYREDIRLLILGIFRSGRNSEKQFAGLVLISMIPAALVGLFLEEQIEAMFNGNMMLVGLMLWFTSGVLYLSDRVERAGDHSINPKQALLTGLMQAVAILPGISRSGSTIGASILLGIKRETAARFSFLMVLPLILGASAKKFLSYMELSQQSHPAESDVAPAVFIAGFVAAFFSGLLALRWMIGLVKRSKLKWFALYCFLAGSVACAYALFFS